jgi:hypothetical protein
VPVVQVTLSSKTLPSSRSSTTASTSCALNCSPSRACRFPRRTAASSARSSSTSIPRGSAPRDCRRWTWSARCRPPT